MSTLHPPAGTLYPWESAGFRNFDLGRLARALFRQRRTLAAWYPRLVVPCAGFTFAYGGNLGPLHAGALVRLWSRGPEFRGRCPDCAGSVLAVSGGGGLSIGHLTGVCRRCALLVTRHMGGFSRTADAANRALAGTEFKLTGTGVYRSHRDMSPLIAVLAELGETRLPHPEAPGLHGRPDTPGDVGEPWW